MRAMQKALGPTALRRQWYITGSTWGGYSRVASKTKELLPLPCIGTSYFSNYFSNYFQQ